MAEFTDLVEGALNKTGPRALGPDESTKRDADNRQSKPAGSVRGSLRDNVFDRPQQINSFCWPSFTFLTMARCTAFA
jgi:hypothetical protein